MLRNYTQNYGIDPTTLEGQQTLIELAKVDAKNNGWRLASDINKYPIDHTTPKGQAALIEIATTLALEGGHNLSAYLKKFSINHQTSEGQAALIEIAKIESDRNYYEFLCYIDDYHLNSLEVSALVTQIFYQKRQHLFSRDLYFPPNAIQYLPLKKIFSSFIEEEESEPLDKRIDSVLEELKDFGIAHQPALIPQLHTALKEELQKLNGKLAPLEFEKVAADLLLWLTPVIAKLAITEIAPSWIDQDQKALKLLKVAIQLHEPGLRDVISDLLIQQLPLESRCQRYIKFKGPSQLPFISLVSLFLTQLNPSIQNECLQDLATWLFSLKSKSKTYFLKDATFVKTLLHVLKLMVDQNNALSLEHKLTLLQALKTDADPINFNKNSLTQALLAIRGLFTLNEQARLKHFDPLTDKKSIYLFLEENYKQAFEALVPLQNVKVEQLFKFLEKMRDPMAIIRYAVNLKSLEEDDQKELLPLLAECLEKKIVGTFATDRCNKSDHLEQIFKKQPDLKEKWLKSEKLDLEKVEKKASQAESLDIAKVLRQSFANQHTKPEFYPHLTAYLAESSLVAKKKIKELLAGKLTIKNKEQTDQLSLEKLLIDLSESKNLQKAKTQLEKIVPLLPKSEQPHYTLQFNADIQGLLHTI